MPFLCPEGDGVRLLVLDGGDVLCLSQLLMLEELMHRLEYDYGRPLRPCEFFHSITGVGAAGVIAILLGVLGMTIADATKAFTGICEKVFAADVCDDASRSERLTLAIEEVLDNVGIPRKTRLKGDTDRAVGCLVSICYSSASITDCRMFRNYKSRQHSHNPTIVEAARASWATPGLFSSIRLGALSRQEELISAVNGFNNPTREAIREAREIFGKDRAVSTLLSLGSGKRGPVSIHSSNYLQSNVLQTDITEENIEHDFGLSGIYYRFSPEHTVQSQNFSIESNQLGSITSYTRVYLERARVTRSMESFLNASAYTSNINLELRGEVPARNITTRSERLPATSRISREEKSILSELKIAGLQYHSPLAGCMKGTRQDIIQRINDWTTDFDAPNILWVKGHPGVGKSAIATEIVDQLSSMRRLGSSFFFQRQNAATLTPHALWRTVAYDLSRRYSTARKIIIAKLEDEEVSPAIANVEKLFHHFIHEPLIGSAIVPNARLPVVVVDALDECGGLDGQSSAHRRTLIRTLQNWSRLPTKFKLIVTSRTENDIEQLFSAVQHHSIEILAGQTVDAQSSEDIRMFLTEHLHQVALRYKRSLSPTWPGAQIIAQLVNRATGLFIWAETVVKLISRGQPEQSLSRVLEGGESGDIDDLYKQILNTAFQLPSDEDMADFRSVVGAIVLAKSPFSFSSLAQLLSMPSATVEYICNGLQSVLDSKEVLRFYHQSFVDFVLEKNKCPEHFFITPQHEHRNLTLACLRLMKDELRFNICGIDSSYLRNTDIPDLATMANKQIPPHLLYSSCWWAGHLTDTAFDAEILFHLQYFMCEHFLSWLEVLSITRRVNLASQILSSLIDWIPPHGQDEAMSMARDMQKFVATFASAISQSAAHIYLSALPFSPKGSSISKRYISEYPQTLTIQSGGLSTWPTIQNVLNGHSMAVSSVAFSPDGKRIVSGSSDMTVRVWDAETGEVAAGPFTGHSNYVYSVAFSPDGKRIVSGSADETVRVWDAETGEVAAGPFTGHNGGVYSVAFSPDGKRIVSGSSDKTVRVWDAETGEAAAGPFTGHSWGVYSVAFSSDGKRIVSGSSDKTVRVWDAETGEVAAGPFTGHSWGVYSVAFSPDGKRIVSGSEDKTVRVWDAETGEVAAGPFTGHSDWVKSVAFSPDGKRIVSGSEDKTVRVWDAETGEVAAGPFTGHSWGVYSVAFSPDGKCIVSGSFDKTIRVWDAETGEVAAGPFTGHSWGVYSVAFSPDGKRIVSGSEDKTVRVWDAETGEVAAGPFTGHSDYVKSVAFSPDGKRIVSGSEDKTVRVWDAETGEVAAGPFTRHSGGVYSVAFSPDGKRIVSGSFDKTIRVWDPETGEVAAGPFTVHGNWVNSVAFSPDGKRIISGSFDKTVRVWDAETGEVAAGPFTGHSGGVNSVAFSPDGKRIVSGSDDKTVRVWDAETGEVAAVPFTGHSGGVYSVAFSPDGKRIVSGSFDKTVRVWDAETGEVAAGPFKGHGSPVRSVALSSDGKRIVSVSDDGTVRVWSAPIRDSKFDQLSAILQR